MAASTVFMDCPRSAKESSRVPSRSNISALNLMTALFPLRFSNDGRQVLLPPMSIQPGTGHRFVDNPPADNMLWTCRPQADPMAARCDLWPPPDSDRLWIIQG